MFFAVNDPELQRAGAIVSERGDAPVYPAAVRRGDFAGILNTSDHSTSSAQ
jgi:hypothetical protein